MKLFDTTNHRIIGTSLAGIFALAVMPSTGGESASYSSTFNVDDLLPEERRTFRYPGSLTTPPCSEGVKWHLMTSPVTVSEEQVDEFRDLYFFNARYTQPLNGRTILEDSTAAH